MALILDLCAGSGAWSEPYLKAGYDVVRVDLLAGDDVRLWAHGRRPHGILAAPPCTMFCRMRMCRGEPTVGEFREALSVVDACLRAVAIYQPAWWALENPQGYLARWLGPPALKFDPWEYGDPWTKRTWVWGLFTTPRLAPVRARDSWVRKHERGSRRQTGLARTAAERSATPPGFAHAFFEANP